MTDPKTCAANNCGNAFSPRAGKIYCSELCRYREKDRRLRAKKRIETIEADSMAMEADPILKDRITEIAHEIGVDRRHLSKYIKRQRMKTPPAAIPQVLDNRYFVEQTELTMARLVSSVDMVDIQEAGLKDKIGAFRGLTEVRQLLKGEPTAIHSYTKIKKLAEIGQLLHAELERRPKVIDAEFEEVV